MTAPHAQAEVLIVDDSMVVRQLLSGIVAAQGYRVCQAADGMEAMALLADGSRHVMLLDYSMPGMSGWDVLRELVAEQRFAQHA